MTLSPDAVALGAMLGLLLSYGCLGLANRAERTYNAGGVIVFGVLAFALLILSVLLVVSGIAEIDEGF